MTIGQIKGCNPTVKRYVIFAGQNLKLSCSTKNTLMANQSNITHTVRRGESLWSISQKYNVSVSDIVRWNKLKRRNKIFAGRKLFILNKNKDTIANG